MPGEAERAFLVGVEFRSRPHARPEGGAETADDPTRKPARIPPQAIQAKSASKTVVSKPMTMPFPSMPKSRLPNSAS